MSDEELEQQIIQQIEVLVEELGGSMCHSVRCNSMGRQSKVIEIEYDVVISSKLLSEFTNKQYNLKYFIALEPDSTFG